MGAVGAGLVVLVGLAFSAAVAPSAAPVGKEVTLKGRVVDLYCSMTGQYASEDHAKCTADCLKGGVPAALETPTGLVLLGQGKKGASAHLAAMAMVEVEARGKLYEKDGLKYLDFVSVTKVGARTAAPPAAKGGAK
jgi:hypothetical protein